MYTALYRAYRPEVFDEILGQEHIVRILKNQINTDTVSHAYLFCGTRGTGKTTTARILAKGINCTSEGEKPCGVCGTCKGISSGSFIDVMEIDAASNNGVDNIRELRESVKYPPAVGKKKVYIIDEVHMLSQGAFNALLKTLEEPPEYVVFILATTEPHKLPATILSRCMRLDFRRVPEKTLISGMRDICERIGIEATDGALTVIAANADGSVRDGLSILDQCISGGDRSIDTKDVLEFLGASGEETFTELTDMVRKGRTGDALGLIAEALSDGKDVRQFMRDWVNHYRNLLVTKFVKDPQAVLDMSVENIDRIRRQSEATELSDINRGILELSRAVNESRWSTQPRILLELAAVKLSSGIQAPVVHEPARHDAAAGKTEKSAARTERRKDAADHEKVDSRSSAKEKNDTAEKSAAYDAAELDAVWKSVFEDGEVAKGSFYIIGSSAALTDMDDIEFTVTADSEHVRSHAERNRQVIEDLMEKHTGRRRHMKLVCAGDRNTKHDGKDDIEDIAHEAEKLLGVDVIIKK